MDAFGAKTGTSPVEAKGKSIVARGNSKGKSPESESGLGVQEQQCSQSRRVERDNEK